MRCLALVLALVTGAFTHPARLIAQPPDLLAPTDALSPADERKAFTVPPGFDVQLVAAEPDIGKPMQLAFDAKGRLWVATSRLYPFPVEDSKGTDKLYVLSDFGDDGKAKKITLFADDLNIPIGIMPLPSCDGCIVSNIDGKTGVILKLTDTNGDGKADKSEVLFSGFGIRDTHGMVNSFTLMPDGWVYACHGYLNQSKVKGKDGHEVEVQSGNVLRFRLDGSRIEVFTRGQVNPFGLAVDPWFNLYTADCHSRPMTALIPGAVYESFGKPHDGLGYGPNMIGYEPGGTGMCGLAWYDADYFPKAHLGMMYLGNVITNRVNAAKIEWTGATPKAVQQPDLIASSDRWFRPVDIKLGPDGAIYVSDFYNKVIGHYEMPLKHPGRDKDRGRIWRVVKKDSTPKMPFADLTKAKAADVETLLGHSNLTVRLLATNQLIHATKEEQQATDSLSDTHTAHRMWVDEARSWQSGERKVQEPLPSRPLVAAHQYRIEKARDEWAREQPKRDQVRRKTPHLIDVDPMIVRAAVEELAGRPHADNIKPLVELIPKIQAGDTHLIHAARIALRNSLRAERGWDAAGVVMQDPKTAKVLLSVVYGVRDASAAKFLAARFDTSNRGAKQFEFEGVTFEQFLETVEFIGRHGDYPEFHKIVNTSFVSAEVHPNLFESRLRVAVTLLRGMQAAGKKPGGYIIDDTRWILERGLKRETPASTARHAVQLYGLLLTEDGPSTPKFLREQFGPAFAAWMKRADVPVELRSEAFEIAVRHLFDQTHEAIGEVLADGAAPPALREKVVLTLAADQKALSHPSVRDGIRAALKSAPYKFASAVGTTLAGSKSGADVLFKAVKMTEVSPRLLQEKVILEKLRASGVADWEKQVGDLTRGLPAADAKLAELIKQRGAKFPTVKADKELGAKLFTKHCAACHAIAGVGGKIAPQLDGVGIRGLERVLEDVLDPNRNVDIAFRARVLNLLDGTSKTGLMIKVDGEVLVMADAEGKEFRVPLKDIEKNLETALSPMPANVADNIPEADFYHLIAYLLDQKAKDPPKR